MLFALGTMAFGVPFILTQYAQEVLGWSPIQFGLASVVMPVTAVIGTFTAQAIATKGGVRRVAVAALALTGLGSLLLTQVSVGGSYLGDLFFALLLLGPGIGAAYVAGSIASLTGVAETEAGLASGLNNASFQIGGAVGVAILSTAAVSGAHGAGRSRRSPRLPAAFAAAIAVAVLGMLAAGLLLGRDPRAQAADRANRQSPDQRQQGDGHEPPIVTPQEWTPRASSCSSRRRSSCAPATRWPPSAAGCRGWPSRRTTASRARTARRACSTCSRGAAS